MSGSTRSRLCAPLAALVLAAGGLLAYAGPAAAATTVLYAAVTPAGTQDCSSPANACDLSAALNQVAAGGVIELVTPGGDSAAARYVGNWTVATSGTSASAPVTIEPEPGLSSAPVLDGDGPDAPAGETCSTASCAGPVLTVPAGEYLAVTGITIADGDNTSNGDGGGLSLTGTATVTGSTFTGNTAADGGAIDNGEDSASGSLTVTASTFSGNTAADGGAIDNSDSSISLGASVTVAASTFSGNTAADGGAIDNGDSSISNDELITVAVSASTFSGNTATDGGAIDNGDNVGYGSVTVATSTFSGNTADYGGATDNAGGATDDGGFGVVTLTASTLIGSNAGDGGLIDDGLTGISGVTVAGDVFAGSCSHNPSYGWFDDGYNVGSDASCFYSTPAVGDVNAGSVAALDLGSVAANGGPTQTVMPQPGSPVIGAIPDPTTVSPGGTPTRLCPATDQRGYASAAGPCDAGAVQTSGTASLGLADSSPTAGYHQAGDVITYDYRVTNTGTTPLTQIAVTDPAVPDASCPDSSLAPGAAETCTGSYTVTAADVAAGKVTDIATATGTTSVGAVISNASSVTVRGIWPASVTGTHRPAAGAAEGYYLGVSGSTWTLEVTHPGTGKVPFTGTITINAGKITGLTPISLPKGSSAAVRNRTLTFVIASPGTVNGFRFATTQPATSIKFTLKVNGTAATAGQIYLGAGATPAAAGSPLTFTR